MKTIKEIMTPEVQAVGPETAVLEVALTMKRFDIGAVPVCRESTPMGMITDRDLVLRCLAEGTDPARLTAQDVMTVGVVFCFESQEVGEAARIMEARKVRRLLVLDRQNRMVGIVTLGDVAARFGNDELTGEIMEKVVEHPPARMTGS